MTTKKEWAAENAVSDFNTSNIPLTKTRRIGQSGIRYIKSMYSSGVSNPSCFSGFGQASGDETHAVGQKQSNGFGLYDMSGNVFEWCRDYMQYDDNWNVIEESLYPSGSVIDPQGLSSGSDWVFRGRSGNFSRKNARSWCRNSNLPSVRYSSLGFRLLRKK